MGQVISGPLPEAGPDKGEGLPKGCQEQNFLRECSIGFYLEKQENLRNFSQNVPSFKAKYQENDRGDCPLTMGYFIITLSFPDETWKFTGPPWILPRRGPHDPCPHMTSRLSRRQAVFPTGFLNFLALGQEHSLQILKYKQKNCLFSQDGSSHSFKLLLRGKILPNKRHLLKIFRSSFLTVLYLLNMISF